MTAVIVPTPKRIPESYASQFSVVFTSIQLPACRIGPIFSRQHSLAFLEAPATGERGLKRGDIAGQCHGCKPVPWQFVRELTLILPGLTPPSPDLAVYLRHYFWTILLGGTRLWKTCKLTTHLQDLPFFPTMLRRALLLSLVVVLGCDFSAAITRARSHHHHKTKVSQSTLTLSSTGRHHRRWRRIFFWNPVFKPSHDSLLKQNAEIDRLELPRIQDDAELEQLKLDGKLVPIIPSEALRVDPRLDPDRRYCRPWTLKFVQDLADAYHQQFGDQIQVNSAVRTVVVQKKLRRHNRNAAPAEGEIASSHLAGVTVDLQRRGMSKAEIHWVENYLIPMKAAGLVEPEEERRQWGLR